MLCSEEESSRVREKITFEMMLQAVEKYGEDEEERPGSNDGMFFLRLPMILFSL